MASADDKHTEILDVIEKRLIPDEAAKKARGEVFTPLNLIREMLYGLRRSDPTQIWGVRDGALFEDDPEDRIGGIPLDVWQNPESKWLDPANGIGNFPFVAFLMLDFQLSKTMKDAATRKKHIVEKMLYMIEIDKGNVNTARKIFETLVPGSKSNICCADTLKLKKEDLMREFGVAEFDVVMGNPPFQAPVVGKRFSSGQPKIIWDKFLIQSLNILIPNGFFVFITPPTWRKPESPFWEYMTRTCNVHFLHIFNKVKSNALFHVSQRIDMYLIKKTSEHTPAIIIDELSEITSLELSQWPFLPNYNYAQFKNILTTKKDGIKIIYSTAYHSAPSGVKKEDKPRLVADSIYKYPVVHNITQKGLGIRYVRNNTKGHFDVSKVLLNKNENQYPVNDFEGKYGMSEMTFGIPISTKEEGDKIVNAINTLEFKNILKSSRWGTFITDYHMFLYFRPDFYKEFLPKKSVIKSRKRTLTKARRSRQRAR